MFEVDPEEVIKGNENHIQKTLQLLLGVVVECEDKASYIQMIISLETMYQQEIMLLLKEVFISRLRKLIKDRLWNNTKWKNLIHFLKDH